ncbi:hypothetical protein HY407_01300 [Candidatus Gottesmanbacteria bacterium]|nr:hypothetical protein [Candidatus Gottesmanbacteria bacterium]
MITKLFKKHEHESNAKALIALFIFLLAVSILLLFNQYQDNIIATDSFSLFLALTVIVFGLLFSLLYVVNNQKISKKKAAHSRSRSR